MRKLKFEKLGDLCTFTRGLTYKKGNEVSLSKNIVLRASNIDLTTGKIVLDDLRYISDEVHIPSSKYVKKGNILICTASGSKSHLGKNAYIEENYGYAFGGFMGQLEPSCEIEGRYFYWFLQSPNYAEWIGNLSDGTNINNLKFNQISQIEVPLLPRCHQRRIVAILDDAFERIDKVIANTEKNIANANDLFESCLEIAFLNLVGKTTSCKLKECTRFIDYRGKTPAKTEFGLRLITAKNVKKGILQKTPEEFVSPEVYDTWMTRGIPKTGDVLFTTEAPLGNVAQLDTSEKVVFAQRIIIIQPAAKILDSKFLKYLLLSPQMQKTIDDLGTGATAKGIKAKVFKEIEITFPQELSAQACIAERLEQTENFCRDVGSKLMQKLSSLRALKQSLLAAAFSGELTADFNPDALEL